MKGAQMIAVIDYGVGNLYSLTASLKFIGADVRVTSDAEDLKKADKIILPGVGAFEDAIKKLRATGLVETLDQLVAEGKPMMGICLGMQLLFEKSYEYGEYDGPGYIKGCVVSMRERVSDDLKVPQIGWNALEIKKDDVLTKYIKDGDHVYFVYGYYADECEESIVAQTNYEVTVPAIVRNGNVCGTQFHPEKSGNVGLSILRAFNEA
jgi:glutamine amidotransferase